MEELRALVDAYAVAADDRDAAAFAAVFAPGGELVVYGADGVERSRYRGADELATVPVKLSRYERTLHLVSTHLVDRDAATGVAYCEAHHVAGGVDHVLFIRYDDAYVNDEGRWRIGRRVVRTLWVEERPVAPPPPVTS